MTTVTDCDLLHRAGFEAFVLSLPGVTLVHQWGDASVAKVGGKIFALLSGWGTNGEVALSFKCSELAFAMLPELSNVRPAPYLARAKWVQVLSGSPLTPHELCAYVREAHRLVATKLPKRVRAALEIDGVIAAAPQRP